MLGIWSPATQCAWPRHLGSADLKHGAKKITPLFTLQSGSSLHCAIQRAGRPPPPPPSATLNLLTPPYNLSHSRSISRCSQSHKVAACESCFWAPDDWGMRSAQIHTVTGGRARAEGSATRCRTYHAFMLSCAPPFPRLFSYFCFLASFSLLFLSDTSAFAHLVVGLSGERGPDPGKRAGGGETIDARSPDRS